MADLPIEIWHSVFNHLELTDLASCARVSKAFYSTVKEYRIRQIAFTRRVHEWFHNEPSIYRHQVDHSMATLLKSSSFNFDCLKRLKIGRLSSIDLNVINKFGQLEELDIDLKNYRNEQSRTLSLANLQMLYLFMSDHLPYLELDTPRLEKLFTFSLKELEFSYPESIRRIHTFHLAGKLSMFRNLEFLIITRKFNLLDYFASYDSEVLKEFSLRNLKKLKQIDFYVQDSFFRMNSGIFKKIVVNILALGRPDLEVFWLNLRITDTGLLTEYLNMLENNGDAIVFHLQNYEKQKDQLELSLYNFNEFLRNLRKAGFNPRSEDFLSKLISKYLLLKIVVNGEAKERDVLMELIGRSPKLWSLEFSDSSLEQSFFDRMADTVRLKGISLRSLSLKNASNVALNFDGVSKLLDLERFETDQQPSAELTSKFFILPKLTYIGCSSGEHRMQRTASDQLLLNGNPISMQELLTRFDDKPDSAAHSAATKETSDDAHRYTCKSTNQCGLM